MTPQSKILLVFFLCLFIVAVVLFVVLRKKKVVEPVSEKNYEDEVNYFLDLDDFQEKKYFT